MTPDATETITLAGSVATSTVVVDGGTGNFIVDSTADYLLAERVSQMEFAIGSGVSFSFGLQSGEGGLFMQNLSGVIGNVYSGGVIEASNSATISGDAISAGPSGLILGESSNHIDITGDAYANQIIDADVGGDAYFQTISSSNVAGATTTAPDQPTFPLPIDDATILAWEADAQAGGTYLGCTDSEDTYLIKSDVTIGPLYVPCNLMIDKNNTDVRIAGPIWVNGNLDIKKGAVIVDTSQAGKVVPMIAHDTSQPDSSMVVIENGTDFTSDTGDAFVMVISMNSDGENGGSDDAIFMKNNSTGELVLYAPHGILKLDNSAYMRQATAWRIHLANSATVEFDNGLANPIFSGTGGTLVIEEWQETY